MNWFVKYLLIPGLTIGATAGLTYGVTSFYKNKKIDNAFSNGYNSAITQESNYKSQLDEYKKLVEEQNLAISKLDSSNKDKELLIKSLSNTISQNETLISSLQEDIKQRESVIERLSAEKIRLETALNNALSSVDVNNETITDLQSQILQLNQKITELQTINELNLGTINSLNTQINLLNSQISELETEIYNNNSAIKQYTDKIESLEKSIKYYESFFEDFENDNQVVATFMFDDSVYNLQIVNKGSCAVVTPPQSTEYKIFNYWMVGDVQTDPSSYQLNESTTFVANITYKYLVLFKNDSVTFDSQVVEKGQHPSSPSSVPQKDGYVFDGWTINGVDVVDLNEIEIEDNITFIAKFIQTHKVKFNNGQSDINTYTVKHGEYLQEMPTQPAKDNYQFDGWTLDGSNVVNPQDVLILEDKTFTAKWTRLWTVTFDDGLSDEHTTYTVRDGSSLLIFPQDPYKNGYKFLGWTINGDDVVDLHDYVVNSDVTFTAKYLSRTFNEYTWNELSTISKEISSNNMSIVEIAERYNLHVGDEKIINVNEEEVVVIILGFNHDNLSDGSGKSGISIGMKYALSSSLRTMNSVGTSVSIWESCDMRSYLNNDIFSQLSSDLQKVIRSVNKNSCNGVSDSNIVTSSDKLWIFSCEEVFGPSDTGFYASGEGEQYDYWKINTDYTYRCRTRNGFSEMWALRSGDPRYKYCFYYVNKNGAVHSDQSNYSCGVYFCFCI